MGQFFTNRHNDYRYRAGIHSPPLTHKEDIRKSILEMRQVYSLMTEEEFATFYEKKYRIKSEAVLKVIKNAKS